MASVPMRCGHSCARPDRPPPGGPARHRPDDPGGVELLEHPRVPLEHGVDLPPGLGEVRRARDVRQGPARREHPDGGVEQLGLQYRELRDVLGLFPPPRLGSTTERAEPGAGGVQQDPVEQHAAPSRPKRRPSPSTTCHAGHRSPRRPPHEAGPGRHQLVGDEVCARRPRLRRLAARPCRRAAHMSSHRSLLARPRSGSARGRRAATPRPARGGVRRRRPAHARGRPTHRGCRSARPAARPPRTGREARCRSPLDRLPVAGPVHGIGAAHVVGAVRVLGPVRVVGAVCVGGARPGAAAVATSSSVASPGNAASWTRGATLSAASSAASSSRDRSAARASRSADTTHVGCDHRVASRRLLRGPR